jgi:hypothetical protein
VDDDYLAALKPLIDAIYRWKELYAAWHPLTPAHMAACRQPNPEVAEECRRLLITLETAGQVGAAWLTAEGVDPTPLLRWLMAQHQPDRDGLVVAPLLDEAQLAVECALHHYRLRPGATRGADPSGPRPNGLEGGRWLWWDNQCHPIPKGTVYRLIEYMWSRDSASYAALEDGGVFESSVAPGTVRSYANKVKNALPSGFPWQLSADAVGRRLTKKKYRQGPEAGAP